MLSNDPRDQHPTRWSKADKAWARVPKPFWTAHAWAAGLGLPLDHKGTLEGTGPVLLVLPDGRTCFLCPTPKGMAVEMGGVWVPHHRAFWDRTTRHLHPPQGVCLGWDLLESAGGTAHARLARRAPDASPTRVVSLQGFAGRAQIAAPTWHAQVEWSFGSHLYVGLSTLPWPAAFPADPRYLCDEDETPTPLVDGIEGGILRMGNAGSPTFQGFALHVSHRFWWRIAEAFDAHHPIAGPWDVLTGAAFARKGLHLWRRDHAPRWMGPDPTWTAESVTMA